MSVNSIFQVKFDQKSDEIFVDIGKEALRTVIGSIDSFNSTQFSRTLFVGSTGALGVDVFDTIQEAVDYINDLPANEQPSSSNQWAIKLFQPDDGYYFECIELPNYVSLIGDVPGIVLSA